METVAEGLWGLADMHEKTHLQLLLKSVPSCFELKCRVYSFLSQCYHLVGAIPPQKQILNKALALTASSGDGIQLATGLQITHNHLGNLQLVSQYLTILGSLALALHDTGQAREILRSSLTLAKKLYDIPMQIWVLSILTALYQELGERGNEMENSEYRRRKADGLQKRRVDGQSAIHHIELIEKVRVEVRQLHELDIKRAIAGPSMRVGLVIPESVGLLIPSPAPSSQG